MLPRLYPQPMPAILPMPEYLATGQRKQWYEEMKASLGVPWMGVVMMAYAHYRNFFDTFWTGVRPLVMQVNFAEECRKLRRATEDYAQQLNPRGLQDSLQDLGYADRELGEIRDVIEVFSHGNFPYLLLATIARSLLEGEEFGNGPTKQSSALPVLMKSSSRPVLMEAHHADDAMRFIYEDIKTTLRLPFVNTDYRALARWPSYFSLAWNSLRTRVAQPQHEICCGRIHERAVEIVTKEFCNPGVLTSQRLRDAAAKDGDPAEVLQVTRLFQWLLPGLVLNVAFMRAELGFLAR